MVSAKATTTTAVKVALLAAVFVLCLAGFGSCQNSGFECTDAYVANTDICEAVCEPGEFLDPIIDPASEYQNGFGYFGYATFAEFVDAYAGYCDDTTLFDEAAPFQTTEEVRLFLYHPSLLNRAPKADHHFYILLALASSKNKLLFACSVSSMWTTSLMLMLSPAALLVMLALLRLAGRQRPALHSLALLVHLLTEMSALLALLEPSSLRSR